MTDDADKSWELTSEELTLMLLAMSFPPYPSWDEILEEIRKPLVVRKKARKKDAQS